VIIHENVFDEAIAEMRRRSKLRLYQTDFEAWANDILNLRNYEKMRDIAHDALFAPLPRTMVKSGNGVGKSSLMAQMMLWAGSVFEEGQTVSIVSAPSIPQLQKVTFAYLKSYHGRVNLSESKFKIPGRVDENLGWVSETSNGKIWLASGRKPPDQDAVSMFQGLRSQVGMTYVWFDEAGGMSRGMFTAAEAVMTGEASRFFGIGNPDNAGTEFQQNFTDKTKAAEYNLHTISVFDTPVYTGERVYPSTVEGDLMESKLLSALTSKSWVEHKQRVWGEDDARYLSKVLGEFPGDSDTAFFPQRLLDLAHDTEIVDDGDVRPVIGADIARYGADESVLYVNRGGRCRLLDSWGKTDTVESARRIHRHANDAGAAEVRIDSSGVGGGVYDMLSSLAEFDDKVYVLIGVDGGTKSPDPRRYLNARAFNHDQLRERMSEGVIDLDFDDRDLTDQLLNVTYRFTVRGAVQITPKDEMRGVMDGSPDRLDALIYAVIDTSSLFAPPDWIQPGDVVLQSPWDMLQQSRLDSPSF
jgi:hypothetical protein